MTFPSGSVSDTNVLLNVDVMNALPRGTNFRSRRLVRVLLALATISLSLGPYGPFRVSFIYETSMMGDQPGYFFITRRLPATVRRPARLVLEFVFVRCP